MVCVAGLAQKPYLPFHQTNIRPLLQIKTKTLNKSLHVFMVSYPLILVLLITFALQFLFRHRVVQIPLSSPFFYLRKFHQPINNHTKIQK
jgi:uncharacterized protein HemY